MSAGLQRGSRPPWVERGGTVVRTVVVGGSNGLGVDPDGNESKAITLPAAPSGGLRGLAAWFAAVGNRDTAAANVLFMGDSITEGTGASSWANRTISKYELKMRARYPTPGVTGGFGYVPATTAFAPVPPVSVVDGATGSHASVLDGTSGGLGMKVLQVKGNNTANSGAVATYTAQTCDRIRVWYTQPSAFAQNGVVLIDGTPAVTLTGSNGTWRGGQVWDSGALTLASHTVAIRGDGTFPFNVEAVEYFNGDWNKGIHVYDGAHFGFATSKFVGTNANRSHWSAVATLQPALFVINLGTIDIGASTVAEYLANVDAVVDKIDEVVTGDHSILWALPYTPSNTVGNPLWAGYRAGLVERRSDRFELIDLEASWPALLPDGSSNKGLMNESTNPLHPSSAGHDYLASIYARATSV